MLLAFQCPFYPNEMRVECEDETFPRLFNLLMGKNSSRRNFHKHLMCVRCGNLIYFYRTWKKLKNLKNDNNFTHSSPPSQKKRDISTRNFNLVAKLVCAGDFKLKAINQKKKACSGLNDFCTLLHSTDSIIKKHKNIKSN